MLPLAWANLIAAFEGARTQNTLCPSSQQQPPPQNLGEYTSTGDGVIEVASVAGLIPAFLSDLAFFYSQSLTLSLSRLATDAAFFHERVECKMCSNPLDVFVQRSLEFDEDHRLLFLSPVANRVPHSLRIVSSTRRIGATASGDTAAQH